MEQVQQKVSQKIGTTRTLSTVRDGDGQVTSRVKRTVLPGGLRVVTEQMAGARSATIGLRSTSISAWMSCSVSGMAPAPSVPTRGR